MDYQLLRLQPPVRNLLLALLVAALVLGIPYLLRPIAQVLLALFAGILLAVFLDGFAQLLCRLISMPRALALFLAILLIGLFFVGLGFFAGPRLVEQTTQLIQSLPQAIQNFQSKLKGIDFINQIISQMPDGQQMLAGGGKLLGRIATFFSTTLGALVNTIVILFVGLYVVINPQLYKSSIIHLLPKNKRARGEEVLSQLGQVLRWWLVGRLASMILVGILTTIGLFIIGEPLAIILGLIAGLLSFIPFLGPILSALPAILIGLARSPMMAVWVIVVYTVVQLIESNLLTPLIQKRTVMLPPAFLLAAQFLFGVMMGFFGVLLATPLAVTATALIQMLYVQDVLKDPVKILGEH